MNEIDDAIKREFDRLGINLVTNDNLAELVILKSNQRKRKQRIWNFIGLIAAFTLGIGIYFLSTDISKNRTDQAPTIIESASSSTAQARVIILDIKGDGQNPTQYSTLIDLSPGHMLEMVSEIPDFGSGSAGTLTVTPAQNKGSEDQKFKFELGYGTHINEFGAFSGKLRLLYQFDDPSFQGRVRIVLAAK